MIKINEANVTIMVKDMDISINFYESIALTLKERWGEHYAMVTAPGVTIGIHPGREKDIKDSNVSIGFMVDDIREAQALLEKNGISFSYSDGKSGKYLHFSDPDFSHLYFVEPAWK